MEVHWGGFFFFVGFSVLEDVMMVSHENWEDVGCGMWLRTWLLGM